LSSLLCPGAALPAPSDEVLAKIGKVEEVLLTLPQIEIHTEHVLHGGLYVRTIRLAPEVVITGAHIKVPTVLVVSGKCAVFVGEGWLELDGYSVIPASKGRKQIFVTREATVITMAFRTDAKTVEEAEAEFTDEAENLMSRRQGSGDVFTITGE
jgi:hypothetical protein